MPMTQTWQDLDLLTPIIRISTISALTDIRAQRISLMRWARASSVNAEIVDILIIGVSKSKSCHVWVIGIENNVALKCFKELFHLENECFHLAVSVKLVTEEIQQKRVCKLSFE